MEKKADLSQTICVCGLSMQRGIHAYIHTASLMKIKCIAFHLNCLPFVFFFFYMYSTFGRRVVMSCTLFSGFMQRYRNALIIIITSLTLFEILYNTLKQVSGTIILSSDTFFNWHDDFYLQLLDNFRGLQIFHYSVIKMNHGFKIDVHNEVKMLLIYLFLQITDLRLGLSIHIPLFFFA